MVDPGGLLCERISGPGGLRETKKTKNGTAAGGPLRGLLQTSLSLPEPSMYKKEKVLLLTKMDLTEFRS